MKIPLIYTWRSLWTRRLTTALTLGGLALVVFVFASVLMLAHGLEVTLVDTGSDDNAIALRRSATSELVSQIDRDAANILKTMPQVAVQPDGKPMATTEVYVVINLPRKDSDGLSNVSVRGVSPEAMVMRPQVRLAAGRMFRFGTNEIIVGSNIARRFKGCEVGQQLGFGGDTWTVVGIFDGSATAFDSEIWGDVDRLMPAFGRPVFSSVTMRLKSAEEFESLKHQLNNDPRTQYIDLKRERAYYEEQSKLMSDIIEFLGLIVTAIFSIGAMIGAMITMYAAVANRTVEIGTLRSLGFRRRSLLLAFLIESVLLSLTACVAGIALASFMSFIRISTVNFGTFSELAFGFSLSPAIILNTVAFAILMGIIGGFLPAVRASRMQIVSALRSS